MVRDKCNVCGGDHLELVIDLGKHPLADTFLGPSAFEVAETHFPLIVLGCADCGHAFTKVKIPAEARYMETDYSYDSSNSAISERHFQEFAGAIVATYGSVYSDSKPRRALDIGSNVGTLLSYLKSDFDVDIVGVEPSGNIANLAVERGVPTVCALFDARIENDAVVSRTKLDVVASTNVMNHIDDLTSTMQTIKNIGSDRLLFAFEVPYLLDLIEKGAFDTIYHEHVNYFTIGSASRLLTQAGFTMIHAERIEYMGGSLRIYAVPASQAITPSADVRALEEAEKQYFAANASWKTVFQQRAKATKKALLKFVHSAAGADVTMCCIGAATKGNTLLNYCGLDRDSIAMCCDVSSLKVGKRMPGSQIPIVHDDDLPAGVAYGIVLPWNLSGYLIEKFSGMGMTLVFPIQGQLVREGMENEALN